MNGNNEIIKHLGYDGVLLSMPEVERIYPNYRDLRSLGADECYFIAGHPVALFTKTQLFGREYAIRISEILHNAWNYRKVLLLIAYSDFEVRVYNCYTKPKYVANDSALYRELEDAQIMQTSNTDSKYGKFASLFSREALDTGALWQAGKDVIKIDISKRVDAYLVDSFDRTKAALLKEGLKEEYIHALLIRSLFVLFLEDKGATAKAGVYEAIMPGCTTYFELLKNKDATYKLFEVLNQHFNGDITHLHKGEKEVVKTKHLDIVRKCFLDGDLSDNPKMYGDWRLFHFDIIKIELLSEIYEHFLGSSKASKGQYYTPTNLVDLILSEKIPVELSKWDLKVLDISCGSGIFLVESYKRLIRNWKIAHHTDSVDFQTLQSILCSNIYGIDIDDTALSVAAFSLYLVLINELDPRTLWANEAYKLPYLIHSGDSEDNVMGNLWCADAISTDLTTILPKMDLVVGNPPYGTHHNQQSIKDYCSSQGFASEMSLPFIHKVTSVCPNGEIALVVNMKILTNSNGTYAMFRRWLLKTAYVEKIYNFSVFRNAPSNFGGSLFSSASTPVAVLFYRASRPEQPSENITYWAPRTYVKSSLLYDIVLDSCDVKYLPRVLCEDNDARIWKIGAWGNMMAHRVVKKFDMMPTLTDTFREKGWIFGRGCNADSGRPDFVPDAILNLNFVRYYIAKDATQLNSKSKAYRNNKPGIFVAPYVVMKECPDNDGVIAGIFGGNAITTTSAFVFNGMNDEDKIVLTCYLNSKMANAILFLTSSTWGIERERLLLEDEAMKLPTPFEKITAKQKKALVTLYNRICEKQDGLLQRGIEEEVGKIDQLFYSVFGLTALEVKVLEDVYYNSLKLFALQEKAEAMRPANNLYLKAYAKRLCESINGLYQYSPTRVSPEVLVPDAQTPLNMVVVRFGKDRKALKQMNSKVGRRLMRKLYRALVTTPSDCLIVQRVLREYDEDKLVLIKPNQRRYWTEMQAIEDGASIFSEILLMKEVQNG